MQFKLINSTFKLSVLFIFITLFSFGQSDNLPAFPGASGHAKYVTGGRGGQVIYVTHLNDDYTLGSLRTAIGATGSRIIVFKVSGTIHLKDDLKIRNSDITIAGQTAPGDGITLADYPVTISADNVIIRFMRFRMGDAAQQEGDALGGRYHKNIMIDHCSMSWSTDECVSFYQNETFTLQWSLISESLRNSVHHKNSHGYGGIWGGKNASFHHNLLAHHDSRNPRLGESDGDAFALTDAVDLRNNVIYNWNGNSCYGGEAMNVNIVNCYYKPGPATTKTERIVSIDKEKDSGKPTSDIWGKFFIDGNVLETSQRATNDNWTYGVFNQFHHSYGTVSDAEKEDIKIEAPHPTGEVMTHTAEMAYEKILEYVGASYIRDTIDKRVIHEVNTGTATYMDGGNGSEDGIIDSQETVGGWPELKSGDAPADTDEDGMPDEWELANGLDPENAGDAQEATVDGGYPNVEVYLNSLVADIIEGQNEGAELVNVEDKTSSNHIKNKPGNYKINYDSSGYLNVQGNQQIEIIEVYNLSGKKLVSSNIQGQNAQMSVLLSKGALYIVKITSADNRLQTRKLLIN
jgi:hypothetical protein